MKKCPACGEQIDDGFDSCWKCAKAGPVPESADAGRWGRRRGGFWCAWRRGWLVLLMMLVSGVVARLLTAFFQHNEGLLTVVGLAVVSLILPPCAYWIFVLFFGQEAWPLPSSTREMPREEQAAALLGEATRLEARGRAKEALVKYQTVLERFVGTAASQDAQKSIESLHSKIG